MRAWRISRVLAGRVLVISMVQMSDRVDHHATTGAQSRVMKYKVTPRVSALVKSRGVS